MDSLITVRIVGNTLHLDIDLVQLRAIAFRVALQMLRARRKATGGAS